jgi:hypothetical protein
VLSGTGFSAEWIAPTEAAPPPEPSNGEARPSDSPAPTRDLAGFVATRGCPICSHLRHVLFDFFANWQHALASDGAAQKQYAEDLGFCPLHAWQLAAIASPLGLSVGYHLLAERISSALRNRDPVAHLPKSRHTCEACRFRGQEEVRDIVQMATLLEHEPFRRAYEAGQGLCLRHLAGVANRVDPAFRQWLIDDAANHFDRLAEDMQGYALKRDAIRRGLVNADEQDACFRALTHISGEKNLYLAWAAEPGF